MYLHKNVEPYCYLIYLICDNLFEFPQQNIDSPNGASSHDQQRLQSDNLCLLSDLKEHKRSDSFRVIPSSRHAISIT